MTTNTNTPWNTDTEARTAFRQLLTPIGRKIAARDDADAFVTTNTKAIAEAIVAYADARGYDWEKRGNRAAAILRYLTPEGCAPIRQTSGGKGAQVISNDGRAVNTLSKAVTRAIAATPAKVAAKAAKAETDAATKAAADAVVSMWIVTTGADAVKVEIPLDHAFAAQVREFVANAAKANAAK
jgi:DNA primase